MITCPTCQHQNAKDATQCEACGTPLVPQSFRPCPVCNAQNPVGQRYCRHCFANMTGVPEDAGQDDIVSPYVPPESSPEEFRGVQRTRRTGGLDDVEEDLDLDATVEEILGEKTAHGAAPPSDQADQPPAKAKEPVTASVNGEKADAAASQPDDAPDQHAEPVGSADKPADQATKGEPPNEEPSPSTDSERLQDGQVAGGPHFDDREESSASEPVADETGDSDDLQPSSTEDIPPLDPSLSSPHDPDLEPSPRPLEGIEDPLPLESVVSLPHRTASHGTRSPSPQQRIDAALFEEVATEEAPLESPSRRGNAGTGTSPSKGMRIVLAILVLLAALTPSLTRGASAPWIQPRQSVVDMVESLTSLPQGSPVLLSFDYGPGYAAEVGPLAQTVVEQLVAQSHPIVAVSTLPEGVGVARGVLDQATEGVADYAYGQDWLLLGYLPGDDAGLNALSHSISSTFFRDAVTLQESAGLSAAFGAEGIDDMAAIIVMADNEIASRRWIEQIGTRHDVPVYALVTARIEPALYPYLQSGQLSGLIAGAYGADQYRVARGQSPRNAGGGDAAAAFLCLLVLVALYTNVAFALRVEPTAEDA